MPLEIWADLLEDQGEDTSALRAWLNGGVISQTYAYCSNNYRGYGYGLGYSNGFVHFNGNGSGAGFELIIRFGDGFGMYGNGN